MLKTLLSTAVIAVVLCSVGTLRAENNIEATVKPGENGSISVSGTVNTNEGYKPTGDVTIEVSPVDGGTLTTGTAVLAKKPPYKFQTDTVGKGNLRPGKYNVTIKVSVATMDGAIEIRSKVYEVEVK